MIRELCEDYYDLQACRITVENQLRSVDQEVARGGEKWMRTKVYERLFGIEKDIKKKIKEWIEGELIYNYWLKNIKGIGPILAGGLIAWLDEESPTYGKDFIERFETISKLWAYCGLHVDEDGRAVRRKKGQMSNWNPRVKTMCWKIGESFVKGGDGYRKLYEQFRKEYDIKWVTAEICGSKGCANKGTKIKKGENKGKRQCMKGHRYAAAKRKTVKVFLAHLLMKWREMKKLPIEHPFIIGRGVHQHLIEPCES